MRSGTALAIETTGLIKRFGSNTAVDGVDLAVPTGGVYGVLGPNGAGKTTTIRMLATLLPIDGGSARVLGHDVAKEAETVRAKVSLTGQFASLDEDLTGTENLMLLGRLYGYSRAAARSRCGQLLDAFGLQEAGGRQVKTYSGGMRRRIDIAASIIVTPELIFLDEPTTGLDPRSRNQVWEIVRALVAGGTTVLLTTQYLDEADQLADRIAVIDHGKVIAEGTTGQLKASVGSGALHVRVAEPSRRADAAVTLERTLGVPVNLESDPAALTARIDDPQRVARALAALDDENLAVTTFALGQPSLDEVFLALTGHGAETTTDSDTLEGTAS
ncbi:ATP-binding cassette domain-containing protein [Prescottella equi]|uniref:ATP-binding cassette domain-containing protein n=1 Tax=Rhodococcus hoagii TaxID=43767 RepID=A0A9Q4ZRF2_RHOHA|nr:ATP-binding cassette domain-containing protein [Prescottella equi]MBM4480119.1 ATP-binding cassette domain-containing protein [Prescottella equi]MBM4488232.1 ATP-binding cassette domain-containing protein [Prescottella equi]MBM4495723.1 ATP-binding cassette domain-containing protein [Prescottella equi]MBM4499413.1 ATP-binding cassette domain-containing protein [Prescottella equi]MBM4504227.1 ATP-binding cassette domain-containing protein [Prescottella equi]